MSGPSFKVLDVSQLCGQSFCGIALGCPPGKSSSMKEGPVIVLTIPSQQPGLSCFSSVSWSQTQSQWALSVDNPRCQNCSQEVTPEIPMIRPQIRIDTHFLTPHPSTPTPTSAFTHPGSSSTVFFVSVCVGGGEVTYTSIPTLRRPKQDDLCESGVNLRHIHSTGSLKP